MEDAVFGLHKLLSSATPLSVALYFDYDERQTLVDELREGTEGRRPFVVVSEVGALHALLGTDKVVVLEPSDEPAAVEFLERNRRTRRSVGSSRPRLTSSNRGSR